MSDDAFKAVEADITTLLFDGPWPADRETIVRLEMFCAWAARKSPGQARSHAINAAWGKSEARPADYFCGTVGETRWTSRGGNRYRPSDWNSTAKRF